MFEALNKVKKDEEYIDFPDEVPEGYEDIIEEEGYVPDNEEAELLRKREELEIRAAEQERKMEQRSRIRELKSDVRKMKRQEMGAKLSPVLTPSKRLGKELLRTGKGVVRMGQAFAESSRERHPNGSIGNTGGLGRDSKGDKFDLGFGMGSNKFDWNLGSNKGGGMDFSFGSKMNATDVLGSRKAPTRKKRSTKKRKTTKKKSKRKRR